MNANGRGTMMTALSARQFIVYRVWDLNTGIWDFVCVLVCGGVQGSCHGLWYLMTALSARQRIVYRVWDFSSKGLGIWIQGFGILCVC